jgi:hypothetical protein
MTRTNARTSINFQVLDDFLHIVLTVRVGVSEDLGTDWTLFGPNRKWGHCVGTARRVRALNSFR